MKALILTAIAATTLMTSCTKTHQYKSVVIFDDTKPMGQMAIPYTHLFESEFQYRNGDTLRGLYADQVIITEITAK